MDNIKLPIDQSAHQKQIFWQVWVPLILGILVVVFLAFLAAQTGLAAGDEGGRFAGVSLILLLTPTLVFCLLIIAALILLIFGIYKLTAILPLYNFKALTYVVLASDFIRLWADRIAQPVLVLRQWLASLYRFLDLISLNSKK